MIGDLIDLASPLPSGSAKQAADAFPIVHDVPIVLAPAPTRVATISLLDHTADGSGLNLGFLCAPSTATKPDQEWPALHSPDTRDVAVRLSFGAGIPPYIPPGLASHMHSEQEPRCLGSTGPAAQLPPADERKLTGIEHSTECPSQPVMLGTSSSVSPVSALQTVMGPTDAKVPPSTKDEQRLSPQAGRAGGPSVTPAAMPKPAQPAVSGAAEGGLVQGPCQPVSLLPCVTDLHSSSIPDSEKPETCAQTAAAAPSASCPVEVPAAMPAAGASGAVPLDSQPVPRVDSSAGADKAVQHWPSSALVLSELSEVQARLSKVEASRESLARDLGQHKAAVARARAMQAERDAATLRVAVDVTPERCRTSAKALLDEANRAQAAASTRTAQVRKLQQVVAHEAEELRTLQAFANEVGGWVAASQPVSQPVGARQPAGEAASQWVAASQPEERLALLTSQTSLSTELAAEQAARAGLQAELAAAQAQLLAAQQAQQDAKKEVWDAKNQSIELAAEAHQLRAQAVDAAEGCTRSLQELGEVRDMGVKLFKQIRAVAHALDRNSHHFQRVPEVALSIRQLQDWCTKQGPYWSQQAQASVTAQASASLSAAGAPGPPSSTAAAAAGDGCGAAPLAGQAGTTAVGVEAEAGALQGGSSSSSSNSVLNGCAGQAGFRGGAPGEAGHTTLSFSVAGLAAGPGSSGAPGLQVVAAAARPPEVPATPAHCQLGWAPGSGFAAADVTLSLSHFRSLASLDQAHMQAVPLGRGRPHSVPAPAPVTTHAPTYELPHFDNITSIVQAQLRELNNDTAPGLDGVPAPFIKHARTVEEGVTTYLLLPLLATWFHSMMRTGKVARISPLFKDTDPTDPNKYKMLAVSSVLYRLYANVLRHVLTAWCMTHKVLPAEQFGFIPGRSTMQPMFILRHLVHAQKASADAKHRKLSLPSLTSNRPMTTYLDNNRGSTCGDDSYVLIDGPHRTPPVTPDQGVKQGCPISPLLFALYVHDISKEFLGPVDAVRVQGTPVTHFMYADDLTLVSTSPHGLQRLVCQLQGFADRKHLTVNVGKSKVMVFNGNSQTAAPSIRYKHEILPVVREFKYLGMHFNPSATPAFAATHMRAGMFLAMRQACKRAREYGVLHDPYALCHLIRAFVLPLGLYGSQVWGTAFLGHGMQLSNPVQTRMLSFLRFAARVRGSVSGLMVLHELGQLPLQLY
ncbi:hypothetical protein QJQ45_002972 [Haematococcus lacustris]|nr:hypothetical protein QJQ45_002972 [Haematococcus lacustris]